MRRLWVAVALAPLTFAASAADAACTASPCTISSSSTTVVDTATVASGSPASIDVTGSVIPATPSPAATSLLPGAVTLNSNNTVTNSGTIGYAAGTSYGVAVQVNTDANYTGEVINSGTINLSETTTGTKTNQGYNYGPFANGSDRYGLYVAPGSGAFTGTADSTSPLALAATSTTAAYDPITAINNTGTISVIGENSVGLYVAGTVNGDVINTGSITITGGTDGGSDGTTNNSTTVTAIGTSHVSYGVLATGFINGTVYTTGSISATGENATALALEGGASAVVLGGSITATGYRSATNPGLTIAPSLNAQQVLQGGPGVYLAGVFANGVQLLETEASTETTNATAVAGGSITVDGSAPAILIGTNSSSTTTTIGAVSNASGESGSNTIAGVAQTPDLVIGGTVDAEGVYDNRVVAAPASETFNATAIQIGGTNPLAFAIGGTGVGSESANGIAANGDAGDTFGNVTMAGGIDITGTVEANALSTLTGNGNATGLIIGSGANVGSLNLSTLSDLGFGVLRADVQTAYTDATVATSGGAKAIAVNIQSGGSLGSISNQGEILATVSPIVTAESGVGVYTGGQSTIKPVAIQDSAGSLTSITNQNLIEAAQINPANALIDPSGVNARGTAIDASANTRGLTITQQAYAGAYLPTGVTIITPTIIGDILFGNGGTNAEALNVTAGTVTGNISWGAGTNNQLTIDGTAASPVTVTGALAQAAGGSLALSVDNGALVMTAPTSTAIGGATSTINLSSLSIGSKGAITLVIDPNSTQDPTGTVTQLNVTGTATFASGAKVDLAVTKLPTSTQTYILINDANGFQGTASAASLVSATPYLLAVTPSVVTTGAGDALEATVGERTGSQLSPLTAPERAEYGALYSVLASESNSATPNAAEQTVLADLLSKTSLTSFKKAYDQFLPDFSGGPFQTLELGQEAIYRAEDETPLKLESGDRRGWVQEIGFLDHRDNTESAGYEGGGFGVVSGLESSTGGDGAVGVTVAYLTGNVKDAAQSSDGHLAASVLEAGAYWRSGGSGLNFDASVNGGWAWFDSDRLFLDQNAPDPTTGATTSASQAASSKWNGAILAAHLGVKAPFVAGRFYVRPELSLDYYALYESAHGETGGGNDFDLSINARTSQEALAQADLVLGLNYGEVIRWRPELTIGYREAIEGGPASTVAHFSGGSDFTLSPDFNDKGGVLARLGIRAGGAFADFSADAGGEYGNGTQNYDARASARFLF